MEICLIKDVRIVKNSPGWYVFPDYFESNMMKFVLDFTRSTTLDEAYHKISAVVGYSVDMEKGISPCLRSDMDAKKLINHFCEVDDLFD